MKKTGQSDFMPSLRKDYRYWLDTHPVHILRQATKIIVLSKMFIKGKCSAHLEGFHGGKACTIGKAEVLIRILFENGKGGIFKEGCDTDNLKRSAFFQVFPEDNGHIMRDFCPKIIHGFTDYEVCCYESCAFFDGILVIIPGWSVVIIVCIR